MESAEERKAREKAERDRKKEEERLRKIEEFKYPMRDELLAADGVSAHEKAVLTLHT